MWLWFIESNTVVMPTPKPIMIQLTPEFLKKNGKPEFVVLPYEEFLVVQAMLEDLEDLRDLRQTKEDEGDASTVSIAEVKAMLNVV